MRVSKKETGIIFKIKRGYYLGLLKPEIMKLLGSTEKNTKNRNGKSVSHYETNKLVIIHCNIVTIIIKKIRS